MNSTPSWRLSGINGWRDGAAESITAIGHGSRYVINSRGRVGEPYPEDIAPHRPVFDREVETVRPRLIIAFGQISKSTGAFPGSSVAAPHAH